MLDRYIKILTISGFVFLTAIFSIYVTYGSVARQYALATSVCAPYIGGVAIEAKTAYILDIKSGTALFEKESSQQIPLASLTKLMTALVAVDVLGDEGLITVSDDSFAPEGDSGLFANEVWRVRDLVGFTLITSSNDGAHALALATMKKSNSTKNFTDLMNKKAQELALAQTYFLNDTGLDVSTTTSGSYGSARDVALLLSHVHHTAPNIFSASARSQEVFTSVSGFEHMAQHTASLSETISGGSVIKTGFTDLAGGNVGIVAEPILGNPVAIVVLQSSREKREEDVRRLYAHAKKLLKRSLSCNSL